MNKFNVNGDLFGKYALIKTAAYEEPHIYKIISAFESNSYCEVPIWYYTKPEWHDKMETVLNVIHCGIDETEVIRVVLKDCDEIYSIGYVKELEDDRDRLQSRVAELETKKEELIAFYDKKIDEYIVRAVEAEKRCKALERAIEGMCIFCTNDPAVEHNCRGWQFDEARFADGGDGDE